MADPISTSARPYRQDLTGVRFTRLTAEGYSHTVAGEPFWNCVCGSRVAVRGSSLRYGRSKSCGCLAKESSSARAKARNFKHGMRSSEAYHSWQSMKGRCLNPSHHAYADYGGRGISVHPVWVEDFSAFMADMGPMPSSAHSVDRIDNGGNYEPGNCRWATPSEQAANRRSNFPISHNGRTMNLGEWAKETGLSRHAIRDRIRRGWSAERALTTPVKGGGE